MLIKGALRGEQIHRNFTIKNNNQHVRVTGPYPCIVLGIADTSYILNIVNETVPGNLICFLSYLFVWVL